MLRFCSISAVNSDYEVVFSLVVSLAAGELWRANWPNNASRISLRTLLGVLSVDGSRSHECGMCGQSGPDCLSRTVNAAVGSSVSAASSMDIPNVFLFTYSYNVWCEGLVYVVNLVADPSTTTWICRLSRIAPSPHFGRHSAMRRKLEEKPRNRKPHREFIPKRPMQLN